MWKVQRHIPVYAKQMYSEPPNGECLPVGELVFQESLGFLQPRSSFDHDSRCSMTILKGLWTKDKYDEEL